MKERIYQTKQNIFILGGPTGVGKGTLLNNLLNNPEYKHLNLVLVPRITTRKLRDDEIEQGTVKWISKEQFEKDIRDNKFLYARKIEFNQQYYGVAIDDVLKVLAQGKTPIFETVDNYEEVIGNKEFSKKYKIVTISLGKTNSDHLKKQLISRGTESLEEKAKRLKQIDDNKLFFIPYHKYFSDYYVLNDGTREELTKKAGSIIESKMGFSLIESQADILVEQVWEKIMSYEPIELRKEEQFEMENL